MTMKADEVRTILEMEHLHGITEFRGKLYLATIKEIYTAEINPDGTLGLMKPINNGAARRRQHHNRTIKFDMDSTLYISIGSTCNSCEETNKESATMLQAHSNGSARRIYARGLRNTIGFDWHPVNVIKLRRENKILITNIRMTQRDEKLTRVLGLSDNERNAAAARTKICPLRELEGCQ
jgi:glucose/arabinose dehydrogenase